MFVYRFSGAALSDAERIRRAAKLVAEGEAPGVVVVSALAGVSHLLVDLAFESVMGATSEVERLLGAVRSRHEDVAGVLLRQLADRDRLIGRLEAILARLAQRAQRGRTTTGPESVQRLTEEIIATGEDLAAEMMAAALSQEGLGAQVIDARRVVRTDDRFGGAVPRLDPTLGLVGELVSPLLERGKVPVLQASLGGTTEGATTRVGSGPDFTATILGAALGAAEVTLWTDVDGVWSADPALAETATVLPEIDYDEAAELAYFLVEVVHPAAADQAANAGVAVRVRNFLKPGHAGTLIHRSQGGSPKLTAVASRPGVTLLEVRCRPMSMVHGFLARVFEALECHRVSVELVATSHTSTALTVDEPERAGAALEALESFAEVEVVHNLGIVSMIGRDLREPGISARIHAALGETDARLVSQASDASVSFVVAVGDLQDVVLRLHHLLNEAQAGSA